MTSLHLYLCCVLWVGSRSQVPPSPKARELHTKVWPLVGGDHCWTPQRLSATVSWAPVEQLYPWSLMLHHRPLHFSASSWVLWGQDLCLSCSMIIPRIKSTDSWVLTTHWCMNWDQRRAMAPACLHGSLSWSRSSWRWGQTRLGCTVFLDVSAKPMSSRKPGSISLTLISNLF